MLKFKGTDVVVYFTQRELEYRRVDGCWEVFLDGMWRPSKDCKEIECQYKKRTALRNLIKRKDEINKVSILNQDKDTELTKIVREIIDTVGICTYIDNTSQELLEKLDTGEVEVK